MTVIQGDIVKPDLGISLDELQVVRDKVNIVIHAASSINLGQPLKNIMNPIIHGSQNVARLALECQNLQGFVFVSTAYVNSYLYPESDNCDPFVEEIVYPLSSERQTNVYRELMQVQKDGHSTEFEAHNFPWPYGYAKHLTERLLIALFAEAGRSSQLLILRPSIIGPAQSFPYPGFSFPKSTPATFLAAGLILVPSFTVRMSSRSGNPETESTFDEVPVDVVVDRMLCHLAMGTVGPVHAVAGKQKRFTFQAFWEEAILLRRIPWVPRKVWLDVDWCSPKLSALARIFVVYAASFDFSEEKTMRLWETLEDRNKSGLQMFHAGDRRKVGLASREAEILECARRLARRSIVTRVLWLLFYSSRCPS